MFFPEELDNRSLRLLIDRTLTRRKEQKPLSKIEQDISDIINEFPELGFNGKNTPDLYAVYAVGDLNPFLQLSAIWEILKQLEADSPKGIKKIVQDYFHSTKLKADDLNFVAETYLALYMQQQDSETRLSEKEYLWEMYYALNQSEAPKTTKKSNKKDTVTPGFIGDAFSAIARELHDDASFIKINPHAPAADIYSQLPIEWINAMSNYWQRPEHPLKRDNIAEIVAFFAAPKFRIELPNHLSREEKACLLYLIQNKNRVSYSEAAKLFGPEHNDGYWWTHDVPKSTLGNLRMKGLIVVGEVNFGDDTQRIAVIPNEILVVLKKINLAN